MRKYTTGACLLATVSALLPLCLAGTACASDAVWLTQQDIDGLRRQPARSSALLQRCEKEMAIAASPVAVYAPPLHYAASGTVKSSVSKNFAEDGRIAYRAALCYAVTQDVRYSRHTQEIISSWSDTLQSVASPQGAAEITFNLPAYVLAASLVRSQNQWNDQPFRHLLTEIALPLKHTNNENNHANWTVFLTASIAAYTGDQRLLANSRARWLELMDKQIAADGSLPLEICRSDTNNYCDGPRKGISGVSYTHYTLLPTTAAARIFELQGQSVWTSPESAKLAAAYQKAATWTLHPETFPYYESNGGNLIGVNNAAYFTLLQRHYPIADGNAVIAANKLGMDALEWVLLFGAVAH